MVSTDLEKQGQPSPNSKEASIKIISGIIDLNIQLILLDARLKGNCPRRNNCIFTKFSMSVQGETLFYVLWSTTLHKRSSLKLSWFQSYVSFLKNDKFLVSVLLFWLNVLKFLTNHKQILVVVCYRFVCNLNGLSTITIVLNRSI